MTDDALSSARPAGHFVVDRKDRNTFLLVAFLGLLWPVTIIGSAQANGLFSWLGVDFGVFWTAIQIFVTRGASAFYDLPTNELLLASLRVYYADPNAPSTVGLALYPPVTLLWYWPFSLLRPDVGYVCWAAANLALAAGLASHVASRLALSRLRHISVVLGALAAFPLGYSLFMGQPTVLWMLALYGWMYAARRGYPFRSGLALGVLALKPPLLLPLFAVLVMKRRWRTIAGVLSTGVIILASTVLLLGVDGLLDYVRAMLGVSSFQSVSGDGQTLVGVTHMISWRGLLANVIPLSVSPVAGLAVVAILTITTLAILPFLWRGRWDPNSDRFPLRVLGTLIVTLLCGYHVGSYSAALLIIPAVEVLHAPNASPVLRRALFGALVISTLLFHTLREPIIVAAAIAVTMLAILAIVVRNELRSPEQAQSGRTLPGSRATSV